MKTQRVTDQECVTDQGSIDQARMGALVYAHPEGHIHTADLPYRLSSWALEYPHNTALWEDQAGRLVAWAVLNTPFWSLDYAFVPGTDLEDEILSWAGEAAIQMTAKPGGRPCWFAHVFAEQTDRLAALQRAGFSHQEQGTKVWMARTADAPLPNTPLPAGFTQRPLAGAEEVEAYVALHRAAFGSENMTVGWRKRTLFADGYRPDLDLVAIAPDGRLAGFCIGWLGRETYRGTRQGQIEPLGIHPEFQSLGLGRALLSETLRRLVDAGATMLTVECDDSDSHTLALYESLGLRIQKKILTCRQDSLQEG